MGEGAREETWEYALVGVRGAGQKTKDKSKKTKANLPFNREFTPL
jgi:hypothetical protein